MEIKYKYSLGSLVKRKQSNDDMFISYITVYADNSYTYGCLLPNGDYKNYYEYELDGEEDTKFLGFKIREK